MFENLLPSYFEWWHLVVLLVGVFVAEVYGALIGGGSIITIPLLTSLGVPLQSAIAIDDGAALGVEAGILSEAKEKVKKNLRLVIWLMIPITMGGILGTYFLLNASVAAIKYIMVVAVVLLLIHTYIIRPRLRPRAFIKLKYPLLFGFMFIIGLYNNFIGVGEGTFSKIAMMTVLGLTFMESHGIKTLSIVPARVYSLVVTSIAGLIVWPYLVVLWLGSFAAGKFATRYAAKIPEQYFKPALTITCIGFIGYLIFIY